MKTAYRAARVIDGVSKQAIKGGAVVVEDGRIVEVGAGKSALRGAALIDLGDATLLPGLIDAHVHLVWSGSGLPHEVVAREGRGLTTLRAAQNALASLRDGITTVRDVGSTDAIAVEIARAIEAGIIPGPRVLASGRAIMMTGGHGSMMGREADGVDAVRAAARAEMKNGAHLVKLMASGGVYGYSEEPGTPQLTVEEMRAAVDEAHKTGRRAAAHAYSARSIANALDAGMDSIEHCSYLTPQLAKRMIKENKFMCPTLVTYQAGCDRGAQLGTPEIFMEKYREIRRASRAATALAIKLGVKIAAGTDAGSPGNPHPCLKEELALMVECGATPLLAIQCATAVAAELLGIDKQVGTLAPGKQADLLAVEGDATANIAALRSVRLVLQAGRAVQ